MALTSCHMRQQRERGFVWARPPSLASPEHRLPGPPCHTGGNNENEASFGWFPQTLANRPLYAVDFSRLFVDVVRQVSYTCLNGEVVCQVGLKH